MYPWCSVVIRSLLQDSTSNGSSKGGVSFNELMYSLIYLFVLFLGLELQMMTNYLHICFDCFNCLM